MTHFSVVIPSAVRNLRLMVRREVAANSEEIPRHCVPRNDNERGKGYTKNAELALRFKRG
jgi:hypothetical protein